MSTGPTAPQAPNINLPPILQDRRVQIGGVVGILLLLSLIIFFVFMGGDKEDANDPGVPKLLLKGVDQVRSIDIGAYLKQKDIYYELVQSETGGVSVMVGENHYDKAVLVLAGNQIVKADDLSLFDKTDWAASDEDRRVKLIRALSGEISRIISRMEGVESATAHLNIPQRKMFRSSREIASASVSLIMMSGKVLTKEQVASIISIIRGYYAEIPPNHVSITDGTRVYSRITDDPNEMGQDGLDGASSEQIAIERRVQSYLRSLVGEGNASVIASVSFDTARVFRNETHFLPGAVSSQRYSTKVRGGGMSSNQQHKNKAPEQNYIYRCNPYDSACRREFLKQDVSTQAYPSYEQVLTERGLGSISSATVSVVIEKRYLPDGITLVQLKKAIAAAAHPIVGVGDVEVLLKDTPPPETDPNVDNTGDVSANDDKPKKTGFPWLWLLLGLFGFLLLIVIMGVLMAAMKKNLSKRVDPQGEPSVRYPPTPPPVVDSVEPPPISSEDFVMEENTPTQPDFDIEEEFTPEVQQEDVLTSIEAEEEFDFIESGVSEAAQEEEVTIPEEDVVDEPIVEDQKLEPSPAKPINPDDELQITIEDD